MSKRSREEFLQTDRSKFHSPREEEWYPPVGGTRRNIRDPMRFTCLNALVYPDNETMIRSFSNHRRSVFRLRYPMTLSLWADCDQPGQKQQNEEGEIETKTESEPEPEDQRVHRERQKVRRGVCGYYDPIEYCTQFPEAVMWKILSYLLTVTSEDVGVPLEKFTINWKQHLAMQLIRHTNKSIALLGFGGTGKSTMIKYLVPELRTIDYKDKFNKHINCEIGVSAYTGIAAVSLGLGGSTVHSYFGFSVAADETVDDMVTKWRFGKYKDGTAGNRLWYAKKIVIDEFPMVPYYMWRLLDTALRIYRERNAPFGGIQIIALGDFAQLRPIEKKPMYERKTIGGSRPPPPAPAPAPARLLSPEQTKSKPRQQTLSFVTHQDAEGDEKLPLYLTALWERCFEHVILFDHVYRQSDPETIDLMKRCRKGWKHMSNVDHDRFRSMVMSRDAFENMVLDEEMKAEKSNQVYFPPLYIYPRHDRVDPWNQSRLEQLQTPPFTFYGEIQFRQRVKGQEEPKVTVIYRESNKDHIPLAGVNQVDGKKSNKILTHREDFRFHGFEYSKALELENLSNNLIRNVPVHMTQILKAGAHVMLVKNLDVSRGLANGTRGYIVHIGPELPPEMTPFSNPIVADTEAKRLEAIDHEAKQVTSFTRGRITQSRKDAESQPGSGGGEGVMAMSDEVPKKLLRPNIVWVKFQGVDAIQPITPQGWDVAVLPEDQRKDRNLWKETLVLVQIPLILMWASTAHKIQGQSLDRMYGNLGRVCSNDFGMAYMILSRNRTLPCFLEEYHPYAFKADEKYIAYEQFLLGESYDHYLLDLPYYETVDRSDQ